MRQSLHYTPTSLGYTKGTMASWAIVRHDISSGTGRGNRTHLILLVEQTPSPDDKSRVRNQHSASREQRYSIDIRLGTRHFTPTQELGIVIRVFRVDSVVRVVRIELTSTPSPTVPPALSVYPDSGEQTS